MVSSLCCVLKVFVGAVALQWTVCVSQMQKSQSTAPLHWESSQNLPNRSVSIPAPPSHQQQEADVSYQYLKHVVLRYMCSEGEEVRQSGCVSFSVGEVCPSSSPLSPSGSLFSQGHFNPPQLLQVRGEEN